MVVKYDSLNRLEKPCLTLCNPGSVYANGVLSKVVGILPDHEAEEIQFNFNTVSEMNLRVSRIIRDDADSNRYAFGLYRAIQNHRLLFIDDIGYFVITNVKDDYDGQSQYKDITAKSIEVELQSKSIPFIENDTYPFLTDAQTGQKGILERIVETVPLWTIGFVDESVATKWRTFEDVDISLNCLGFLMEQVQDAYECIIVFDCINRVINVYAQSNYVRRTNIHLTKDDLINELGLEEDADDLYTALSVFGGDELTISAVNPTGTNIIYNFSNYLDWMSEPLGAKVSAWQLDVENAREEYMSYATAYYGALDRVNEAEMEANKLASQEKIYLKCRDNIVAESDTALANQYNKAISENGGTQISIASTIDETLRNIDQLVNECRVAQVNNKQQLTLAKLGVVVHGRSLSEIRDRLRIQNYFTEEEQAELNNYIFEGQYTDDYIIVTDQMSNTEKLGQMRTLYERAADRMRLISVPTQEFSVSVESFIFLKQFEEWSKQLETGCLINVELDVDDIAELFLTNITVNYDDLQMTMKFGNRFNRFDPKALFDDILGNISKTANTLGYLKEAIYPIRAGEFDGVKEAMKTSRTLTMGSAISSENEEVIIDGSGYTGRKLLQNGDYDPMQVKLTGKNLVFTSDAWQTCRVALGEIKVGSGGDTAYGINAETLIGDMIIGNNLQIYDENGTPIFEVVDGKIHSSIGDLDSRVTELQQTQENVQISIKELQEAGVSEVVTTTGYTFDADGLSIHHSKSDIKNLLNNNGMYVIRINGDTEDTILTANNDGVNAMNLTARQYMIVGDNSRFENYVSDTGEQRTACFFIGS